MSQSKRKAWDATMQASGHAPTRKSTKRASGKLAFWYLPVQQSLCVPDTKEEDSSLLLVSSFSAFLSCEKR